MGERTAYQRGLRDKALANGYCGTCRRHHVRPGMRTCAYCGNRAGKHDGLLRQALYNECCQQTDEHRFDCREVEPVKRGKGPLGPTSAPSVAEIVAAMRRAA